MPRSIDPVTLALTNGEERKFLLSMGGVRRLKERFAIKSIGEVLSKEGEDAIVAILHESLLDKDGNQFEAGRSKDLTESTLADLLPSYIEDLAKAVAILMGASFPDRPPKASPTPTVQ